MKTLEDVIMELVQVREAIDMAETVLEHKESEGIRQQLEKLKKEEATLSKIVKEWSE